MMINSYAFGTVVVPMPHLYLLTHFDLALGQADGSQTILDSANRGNSWSCSSNVRIKTISGDAKIYGGAALLNDSTYPNLDWARVTWPTGLSFAGEFSVEFTWKTPEDFSPSKKYFLLTSSTAENEPETPGAAPFSEHLFGILFDQGSFQFYTGVYGYSDTRISFTDFSFTANTSYKIMITRDQDFTIRCFKDGIKSSIEYQHNPDLTKNGHFLRVGRMAWTETILGSIGYMDELRITDLCLAVSDYTPPTSPFAFNLPVPYNT